jgi:DNA polymerase-3 subunit alpha
LHVHTDYSLLDGACSVSGLAELAKEFGMPAVAMTDHGAMGGAIDFYQTLNKNGVKPIIGCEAYVAPTTRFDKDQFNEDIRGFHLVLLAKDSEGYANLCELVSAAYLEGFYHKPRIDKEILAKHAKGLLGLSACVQGEIPKAILRNNAKHAEKVLDEYLSIFGRENFYLELMDHGMPEQIEANKGLVTLSKKFDIPLVATNDAHYLRKEHAKAHDLLLCVQTHSTMDDEKRFKFSSDQFYFRSGEEMAELFREIPEAISNTLAVAEKCDLSIPFVPEVNHYPVYNVSAGTDREKMLRDICLEGIPPRYGFDPVNNALQPDQQAIIQRMDYELGVINSEKYTSYFLVVWDFVKYAKENGIPVGPGRGSGAGSIVAYLTGITNIDPIEYGLLFERFLNPERVSPPDFDIDFCERRRAKVVDYVREKYGSESVAQIGTYGTLKAKAVVKDVARAMGLPYADGDKLTKLFPGKLGVSLQEALEQSKELAEFVAKEKWAADIFENAKPLENLNRNMSIHAAGVIIGDQRLARLVPLARGANDEIITQYPAGPCEALGLLKMDFLGLRTLTVIQDSIDYVEKTKNEKLDFDNITLDDKETYNLLNRGDTVSVFQLESPGMRDLCVRFGVRNIKDIIALIALYRPGPMQFADEFVGRRMGTVPVEYDHPSMKPILEETFGIMLYQEQIMQTVQAVAGFSLAQADILRRAVSKKKEKQMEEVRLKFMQGCAGNAISQDLAEKIWEKIDKFAGYGFNKSHSAAYALLAYRTAYLKAHYPVEFMAAVLNSEIGNPDKMPPLLRECREMEIDILPPDVNVSERDFTVDGDAIRFGLAALKGVGSAAANAIIDTRKAEGKFQTLLDFCERVGSAANSRVLETLARSGSFESFGLKRSQLVAIIDQTISMAQSSAKDKETGQASLFDMLAEEDKVGVDSVPVPDIQEFHEREMLENEKELLGFYVTGHPLGEYAEIIETYSTHSLADVHSLPKDTGVKVGGIVTSLKKKQSKKGADYAIMQIEDVDGAAECLVFDKVFQRVGPILTENAPVFVSALVDRSDDGNGGSAKLIAEDLQPLNLVPILFTKELHIRMHEGSASRETVQKIKEICAKHPGDSTLIFCLTCATGEIVFLESTPEFSVAVKPELKKELTGILGEGRLHYNADKSTPKPKPKRDWDRNNRNGTGRRSDNG